MKSQVRALIAPALIGSAILVTLPLVVEVYTLFNLTVFAVMAILALSLGLVWGFAGILSLGQAAFFGIGAYAYALAAINFNDSTPAIAAAILVPIVFALIIGYVAFYGRVSDVYFGVISLTLSLIIYNLINATSGSAYSIGSARIGGYNGIPSVPPVNMPFDPSNPVSFEGMFILSGAALLVTYLALRLLLASRFGRIAISIRENETRSELLGYDARLHKLGIFCIGAGIAGFAGALFASWGSFIGPDVFSLGFAAQVIIWVLLGGLGTLIGPVLGSFLIQGVTTYLGENRIMDPNIALGLIFIAAVLLLPRGIVPSLRAGMSWLASWRRTQP